MTLFRRRAAPRPWRLRVGLGLVAAVVSGGLLLSAFSKPAVAPLEPVAITVEARPVARFKVNDEAQRFGPLEFLGGLVLTSSFPGFGGISAFRFDGPDNHFLALTDAGLFLSGRLVLDGERPVGFADMSAVALRDGRGRAFSSIGRSDSESLAVSADAVYVGLEGRNEIWRFPRPPLAKAGVKVPAPGIGALAANRGLETLLHVPSGPLKGALIGIGEEGKGADDLPGFIIGGAHPGTFTLVRHDAFAATDAALTPDGVVILLERHYTRLTGVKLRLRRFALSEVKPGAVIDPQVLGTFDMGYQIDNMEGIAVTQNASGDVVLTLISDDNFNPLQRTILLRFALAGD